MSQAFIAIREYCQYHREIEPSFIEALFRSGLITRRQELEEDLIDLNELPDIEQYARLHYELEINLEGIEAIAHLLKRVEKMQDQIQSLNNRISFYSNTGGRI